MGRNGADSEVLRACKNNCAKAAIMSNATPTASGPGKPSEAGTAGEARRAAEDGPDTDRDRNHALDPEATARQAQAPRPADDKPPAGRPRRAGS